VSIAGRDAGEGGGRKRAATSSASASPSRVELPEVVPLTPPGSRAYDLEGRITTKVRDAGGAALSTRNDYGALNPAAVPLASAAFS
jgi:hypothetical protein